MSPDPNAVDADTADADGATDDGSTDDGSTDDGSLEDAGLDADTTPACVGTPPSCVIRPADACAIGVGCTWTPRCAGLAEACWEQDAASCANVEGCSWNATTARCAGIQKACTTFADETSCIEQPGCFMGGNCAGTIAPCGDFDALTCEGQIGCDFRFDAEPES